MFKVSDLREFIRLLDETSLHELHIESGDLTFHISKANQPAAVLASPPPAVAPPVTSAMPSDASATMASAATTAEATLGSTAVAEGTALITSPMVGTFYCSPSPSSGPYVEPGTRVTEKSVVCIVEAMKLMNEIEADVRGEIIEVMAENGSLVEYGQPLFRVKLA
ncbi:MAG: acetyl-CoA carboxylase biotin carboxyl carrier protein [Firmicutes bacterium]|nr:acetyl-CoA carboxylase biotin carboxyl carrier protein [Bacillota bacterium]